jgi:ubiquinone/menaquinone biosynthesis C-methylase UbiE
MSAAELDIKTKQIVYHDWESGHYDDKWSISFDDRCIDYALGRYLKAVPDGRRYDKVLEVGCGTGFFLLNLAQAGVIGEAHCTDISEGMVDVCVMNGARLGIDVEGRVADAERLPYGDAEFDLVIGHAVVHHLPDLDQAFSEFFRVLRPGGVLAFAGEPSRHGDRIAAYPKRAAVKAAPLWRRVMRAQALPPSNGKSRDCGGHHDDHALERFVDVHAFDPGALGGFAKRAGFGDVNVRGEELLANWFGWTNRTLEASAVPETVPWGWRQYAFRGYLALQKVDRALLEGRLPAAIFYNLMISARKS